MVTNKKRPKRTYKVPTKLVQHPMLRGIEPLEMFLWTSGLHKRTKIDDGKQIFNKTITIHATVLRCRRSPWILLSNLALNYLPFRLPSCKELCTRLFKPKITLIPKSGFRLRPITFTTEERK